VQKYVLTGRGKLIIAMLIVFFIVLPTLLLVIWAVTRDTLPDKSHPGSNDIPQSADGSTIFKSTLGTASGSILSSLNGDGSGPVYLDPSIAGPVHFDLDAGILTFLFTPDMQSSLDENSLSVIGAFLTSPQNNADSKIAVEIPQLPDEDTALLTKAIIDAFIILEVPLSDITFIVYQTEPDTQTFEIKMFYQ